MRGNQSLVTPLSWRNSVEFEKVKVVGICRSFPWVFGRILICPHMRGNHLRPEKTKIKRQKKIQHATTNQKNAVKATFISFKVNFQTRNINREKRGHYIMLWDGWLASPTQWTWVWASSGSWWWTGKPGVLQSMGSQRVRHHWATELNITLKQSIHQEDKKILWT